MSQNPRDDSRLSKESTTSSGHSTHPNHESRDATTSAPTFSCPVVAISKGPPRNVPWGIHTRNSSLFLTIQNEDSSPELQDNNATTTSLTLEKARNDLEPLKHEWPRENVPHPQRWSQTLPAATRTQSEEKPPDSGSSLPVGSKHPRSSDEPSERETCTKRQCRSPIPSNSFADANDGTFEACQSYSAWKDVGGDGMNCKKAGKALRNEQVDMVVSEQDMMESTDSSAFGANAAEQGREKPATVSSSDTQVAANMTALTLLDARTPWQGSVVLSDTTVCFEWTNLPGAIQFREEVRLLVKNHPEWEDSIAKRVKDALAEKGITNFLVFLDSKTGWPSYSIKFGKLYVATEKDFVANTKKVFLDQCVEHVVQ